ncbi:hypothetical protein ACWDG1_47075 [Streptomyces sp. NPDC001177]
MHLIPDTPFPELGFPFQVTESADGHWLAVSCHASGSGGGRVAVYRLSDLALWEQLEFEHGVECLAFHPSRPVLALGTEEGDDEYERQGQLILYEPETRVRATLAFDDVGVTAHRWTDDGRSIELTLSVPDAEGKQDGFDRYLVCIVDAETLTPGPRSPVEVDWTAPERLPRIPDARAHLAELAARRGHAWAPRDGVTVLEPLRDGRVLAVLRSRTLLECWSGDGEPLWSVTVPDEHGHVGRQVYVAPDQETAWVPYLVGDSADRRTRLLRLSLTDGTLIGTRELEFPVDIVDRTDGAWIARDSRDLFPGPQWPPYDSVVFTPSGRRLADVPLGECDGSYGFRVRRSPYLLVLRGLGDAPGRELLDKWVSRVTPDGVETLFPFAWDASVTGYLRGGPAVYVDGDAGLHGPGLLHACNGSTGPHVLLRALPGGEVLWAHRTDAEVVGLDVHEGLVHAVTRARELLTMGIEDGKPLGRTPTAVGDHVFAPLCLAVSGSGRVLIGTAEGRILVHAP